MFSFAVDNPKIATVLLAETGQELPTRELISNDFDKAMEVRHLSRTSTLEDRPLYLCPECFSSLRLIQQPETRKFHFRHSIEDGRCSVLTRGELSKEEINAIKYNGQKESFRHREIKQWLVDSLQASGLFQNIAQEKRWEGKITGAWRKPDVSATFNGLRLAFEVQLSTTFIDVILERRQFYQKEGGLLIWVFGEFPLKGRRLMQDDVFHLNNHNAFIVNKSSRDQSVAKGQFYLDCVWAQPSYPKQANPPLYSARISFEQLTLDRTKQEAYVYNYASNRRTAAELFEEWFLAVLREQEALGKSTTVFDYSIADLMPHELITVIAHNNALTPYLRKGAYFPFSVVCAFYSAKHGRPIGIMRKKFIEIAHFVEQSHPSYLRWFRRALEVYERGNLIRNQDTSGKWKKKVTAYKPLLEQFHPRYQPDIRHLALLDWLFPKLQLVAQPVPNVGANDLFDS